MTSLDTMQQLDSRAVLVDSMEFTANELESAVHYLATPFDSERDSGTSLRKAFEVHMCQYMKVGRHLPLKNDQPWYRYRYSMRFHMKNRIQTLI